MKTEESIVAYKNTLEKEIAYLKNLEKQESLVDEANHERYVKNRMLRLLKWVLDEN